MANRKRTAPIDRFAMYGYEPPDSLMVSYRVRWPQDRYKGRSRLPDTDGLPRACKPILDGICDALGIDDDRVVEVRARQEKDPEGIGVVIVLMEEAGA